MRLDDDACPPTGAAHVVGEGSLTVMEPRRRAAVRAVGQGSPPLVEVLADTGEGPQVIASAPADAREGGGWSAEVWAQGIVGCRLSGEDMRICVVCFGDADETGGWQKLNEQPVLTPVVTPGTANEPANLHGPAATRTEARGRLSASLPRGDKDALSAGFADVGELVEDALRDGRGALLPAAATDTTGARTPPRLALATLSAVAVTAVDPDVARMLGLYWHDPVDDGQFDYKVVAHHGDVRYPSPVIAFDELAPGAAGSTLDTDGVHFVGTAGLEIVVSGRTRALRVPAPVIGTAAGLRLDRPCRRSRCGSRTRRARRSPPGAGRSRWTRRSRSSAPSRSRTRTASTRSPGRSAPSTCSRSSCTPAPGSSATCPRTPGGSRPRAPSRCTGST